MCEEEGSVAFMSGQILICFFHSSSLSGLEPREALKKINSSGTHTLYMPGRLKWSSPICNKMQIYLKIIEEPDFYYRTCHLTKQCIV